MSDANRLSQHRQKIHLLKARREELEHQLLRRRLVIRASLIERHLGTKAKRRSAPAYYLSKAVGGHTRLSYVSQDDLDWVRERATAWREFRGALVEWVRITRQMERLLRQLGEMQEERGHARQERKTRPSSR